MAARKKAGLGKGLGALITDATEESGTATHEDQVLSLDKIKPNPNQPRSKFDEEELSDLAASIKKDGLLQPILVRPKGSVYEIIAGERRYHACKQAGLNEVPVRILDMDEEQTLRVALIENLQRSDLNAIEEARGYKSLMSVGNLTQSELAEAVSKSRSAVANSLRLLDLPEEIQEYIYDGMISAGHARAILSVQDSEKRLKLADKIASEKLSVREAENLAKLMTAGDVERVVKPTPPRSYKIIAQDLKKRFNTSVKVKNSGGKNKIEIVFKDEEDLQRIYNLMKNQF